MGALLRGKHHYGDLLDWVWGKGADEVVLLNDIEQKIIMKKIFVTQIPVAPKGCPSAIAPPLTLIFSGSSSSFLRQYTNWDAKACVKTKPINSHIF